MSRYRKIEVKTWGDEKFRRLSPMPPSGQGLWLFLMTGPHTSAIPGLFKAGRAALAEDLGWDQEGFDKAFGEVSAQGMAKADFKARLMWLPKAIHHNKPESPNVVRSWRAELDLLPECDLKREAIQTLRAFLQGMGASYVEAFDELFRAQAQKATPKPCAKPSKKATPNQEQEQEQEQEKKQPRAAARGGYTPEFEEAWGFYPKRAGGNNKADAFKAWNARLKDGHTAEVMTAGVVRYATYCRAAGKQNTEFVKQASTFFGPSLHFTEPWPLPNSPASTGQGAPSFHEKQLASKRSEYERITGQQSAQPARSGEVIDITPRQEVIAHG
jgi:hypothetical protein